MGEGQTWFWVFLIVCFSSFLSLILMSFLKKKDACLIMRLADILAAVVFIFIIMDYLAFTSDNLEPWLVQAAWFFRYHGFMIGLFLGLIIVKTVAGISLLITGFNEHAMLVESSSNSEEKALRILTLSIISMIFAFYITCMVLYRYFTLFNTFLFIFTFQLIVIASSAFLTKGTLSDIYSKLTAPKLEASMAIGKASVKKLEKARINEKTSSALKERLRMAGTSYKYFRRAFFPLLFVVVIAIVIIGLMPLNITIWLYPSVGDNTSSAPIPLAQILTILLIVALFFLLIFLISGGRSRLRFAPRYREKRLFRIKIASIGFLDGMRILGLIFAFGLMIYYYNYPMFFPYITSFVLLYAIAGAFIYYLFSTSQKSKNTIYTIAVLLLVLSLYLTYSDGITNALSYAKTYGGSYDITFPFEYLHGNLYFMMVGVPIGVISSDLLMTLMFKQTEGRDSTNRALMISISSFVGGVMIHPFNWLLNNPGGAPPLEDQSGRIFTLFCFVLIAILLLGLLYYQLTEVLIP